MPFLNLVLLKINYETLDLMLKFGLAMIGLLLIIWFLAVITPRLAKVVDRIFRRVNVDKDNDTVPLSDGSNDTFTVYDIYEGAKLTSASRDEKVQKNDENDDIS